MDPISAQYDGPSHILRVGLCVGMGEPEVSRTHHSTELDFHRYLEYDKDGRLLAVVFLAPAERGIDLRGVPEAERIAAGLEQLRGTLGLVLVS